MGNSPVRRTTETRRDPSKLGLADLEQSRFAVLRSLRVGVPERAPATYQTTKQNGVYGSGASG
jgi:hypothetical protein